MTLQSARKILSAFLLLLLLLFGLWVVVVNRSQVVTLNLLFVEIPAANMGIVTLGAFVLGVLVGLLVALLVFRVLPTRWQLRQVRKEVDELRKQNARPPML